MNPLVQPAPGLLLWSLLTFLGLLFALKKLAWGPLLAALETRQNEIRTSLDDAQKARQELERLNQESAIIINKARAEAAQIIVGSRGDAERLREDMKQKARAEADAIVKNAERQIQMETARALQQIRSEAVDLSVMIASKLIGKNLTREDNERLIEDALKQVSGPQH